MTKKGGEKYSKMLKFDNETQRFTFILLFCCFRCQINCGLMNSPWECKLISTLMWSLKRPSLREFLDIHFRFQVWGRVAGDRLEESVFTHCVGLELFQKSRSSKQQQKFKVYFKISFFLECFWLIFVMSVKHRLALMLNLGRLVPTWRSITMHRRSTQKR